jgi:hypothetical protein
MDKYLLWIKSGNGEVIRKRTETTYEILQGIKTLQSWSSASITGSENVMTLGISRPTLSSEQFQKIGAGPIRLAGHKLPSVRD